MVQYTGTQQVQTIDRRQWSEEKRKTNTRRDKTAAARPACRVRRRHRAAALSRLRGRGHLLQGFAAGGAHHTVLSTALTAQMMEDWCEMMQIECVHITKDTKLADFKKELFYNDIAWKLKNL